LKKFLSIAYQIAIRRAIGESEPSTTARCRWMEIKFRSSIIGSQIPPLFWAGIRIC